MQYVFLEKGIRCTTESGAKSPEAGELRILVLKVTLQFVRLGPTFNCKLQKNGEQVDVLFSPPIIFLGWGGSSCSPMLPRCSPCFPGSRSYAHSLGRSYQCKASSPVHTGDYSRRKQ